MTIRDAYQTYHLMKNLQEHQLRVAGVAKILADLYVGELDREEIVLACLLHDMGNILKFDLTAFPDFLQPEGLEYWQNVQETFRAEYGSQVHDATERIAAELGVSARVQELIVAIGFNRAKVNRDSDDVARKICAYADMRVAPLGVVDLETRLADGRARYGGQWRRGAKDERFSFAMAACIRTIEQQLMELCPGFVPAEVTEETVQKVTKGMLEMEIG